MASKFQKADSTNRFVGISENLLLTDIEEQKTTKGSAVRYRERENVWGW